MKKTIKKRAFISAIAMLIVSAIVLTSSTFAWFSMAKRVEVETMQLNITSPEGIQISANTNAFTTALTMDDFTGDSSTRFVADTDNTNHFPEVLSPSSSRFYVGPGTLPTFYSGSINDQNKITLAKVEDATSGYVVFDLFVKLGTAQKVYWGESTITCDDNADVPTAMRIAMVNCGSGDKTAAKTVTSKIARYGGNNTICIFEPDAYNHTDASGKADGAKVATSPISSPANNVTPGGGNIITDSAYLGGYGCAQADEKTTDSAWFDGAEGINRIRVYIWVEGQDVDCANDVAGSTIDVNLVLTIA